MDRAYSQIGGILEEAACIVRRCKETTGDAEQAESYKREQVKRLKEYADSNGLWINIQRLSTVYLDKGGENEVYYDGASTIYKLNNFEYAGEDLVNFFTRINAHNLFFGNVSYDMVGFSYNSQNEFCAVLIQPYIQAKRETTEDEIALYMELLGFTMDSIDEYYNDKYEVFDVVPNNVLYGVDDDLYFIDTQIRLK